MAEIGPALAVHDGKRTAAEKADRPPIHGPPLRDAALKLSGTKTLAEALSTVPNLTTAVLGQAKPAGSITHPWTGLISLHPKDKRTEIIAILNQTGQQKISKILDTQGFYLSDLSMTLSIQKNSTEYLTSAPI